jgi:hypothetical protein
VPDAADMILLAIVPMQSRDIRAPGTSGPAFPADADGKARLARRLPLADRWHAPCCPLASRSEHDASKPTCHTADASSHVIAVAWSGRQRTPHAACPAAVRRCHGEGDGGYAGEADDRHGSAGSAGGRGRAARGKSTDCPDARCRIADGGNAADVAADRAGPIGRNGAGPACSQSHCHRNHAEKHDPRSPTAYAGGTTVTGCTDAVPNALGPGHASGRTTHRSRHAATTGSISPTSQCGDRGRFCDGWKGSGQRAAASCGREPGRAPITRTGWTLTGRT